MAQVLKIKTTCYEKESRPISKFKVTQFQCFFFFRVWVVIPLRIEGF